jgi:recombinational DNA repair protein RecR
MILEYYASGGPSFTMAKYPFDLIQLIAYLKKLPGVGTKTAERFALNAIA